MEFDKELSILLRDYASALHQSSHAYGHHSFNIADMAEKETREAIKQAVDTHIIGEDEQYDCDKSAAVLKMKQRKGLWGKGEEHGR